MNKKMETINTKISYRTYKSRSTRFFLCMQSYRPFKNLIIYCTVEKPLACYGRKDVKMCFAICAPELLIKAQ